MKLKKVRIRGFRSIKEQTLQFNQSCQILVGINEAGKSNLLRALRLLDKGQQPTVKDRRRPLEGEPFNLPTDVYFDLELSGKEKDSYFKAALSKCLCKDPDTELGVFGKEPIALKQYVDKQSLPLYWVDLGTLKKHFSGYRNLLTSVSDGWFKVKTGSTGTYADPSGTSHDIGKVQLVYKPHFPDFPSEVLEPATPHAINIVFTLLHGELFDKSLPACVFWTYDDKFLLPSSIEIEKFVAEPTICIPLQQMFLLAEVDDIGKAIAEHKALGSNTLRSLLERVALRATKHVKSIWKEYKNFEIRLDLNGDSIDASVVDHFNRFDFFDRSDGFKRFMSLLLVLSAQARAAKLRDALILIDEAEIGLHPSGVRYLRDELIKVAELNQVVVSTHSIFMIDKECVERHLIVKKNKETTEVARADKSNIYEEEVLYNALNYSMFEMLRDFNLIFEGWRDKQLFTLALKDKRCPEDLRVSASDWGMCHLQGVNDAGRVVPLLELAQRQYVVLSDSDEAASKAKEKFHGAGKWLRYSDLQASVKTFVTSEDFISASAINPVLKRVADAAGVPPLTLDDSSKRKPRISQIRSWLQSIGREGEELKDSLNAMKEDITLSLKAAAILDSYFEVLNELATSGIGPAEI